MLCLQILLNDSFTTTVLLNVSVDFQVRIDHTSRTLSFGSDLNYSTKEDAPVGPFLQNMPSEQIRNQLTAMSSALAKSIQIIKPASILVRK